MDDSNGNIPMTMLVGPAANGTAGYPYPVYMGSGFGNNNGGFGGDSGWIVLLLILALAGGGWGNGMGGGFFGGGLGFDFPWLMAGQQGINNNVSDGFRDAQLHDSVTSVRDGISNLSTQLCDCCGDMQMALANGFAGVEQGANARQMADMQQNFALQSQLANGFSGTSAGLADVKYTIATEACADRAAVTQGIQTVLDKLCSLELDNYRRENDQLRTQLNMANLAASQTRQTAEIQNNIVNELRSCPIPAQPVYGSQPIFTCPNNNNGCGCGSNVGF